MILKRASDIIISLFAIVFLSPIFIILSILVYLKIGGPIFFVQQRVGKNNKVFKIIKFRTMMSDIDKKMSGLSDQDRLTNFGKTLRSTSLDELPEFINVIKGEMSIVGPRPLLVEYLPHYDKESIRRHDVLPGITGWAQINGRNSIGWKTKFALDVWYVDNWSMMLDFKIIVKTIGKVFSRHGVNQDDNVTMEKFTGLN